MRATKEYQTALIYTINDYVEEAKKKYQCLYKEELCKDLLSLYKEKAIKSGILDETIEEIAKKYNHKFDTEKMDKLKDAILQDNFYYVENYSPSKDADVRMKHMDQIDNVAKKERRNLILKLPLLKASEIDAYLKGIKERLDAI